MYFLITNLIRCERVLHCFLNLWKLTTYSGLEREANCPQTGLISSQLTNKVVTNKI